MIIEQKQHKGYQIAVVQDPDPLDPREWDYDNQTRMLCITNSRYNLGDKHDFESMAEIRKATAGKVRRPLYLMDHSGLSMSVGDFGCPWDSGMVGYIVSNYDPEEVTEEQALSILKAEVETYSQYLSGSIYGVEVKKTCDHCGTFVEVEDFDSVWGFYSVEDAMKEGLAMVGHEVNQPDKRSALEKLLVAIQEARPGTALNPNP